ncbi:MAG: SAM-dependent methyltransferase [Thermoplasmata archaeon]
MAGPLPPTTSGEGFEDDDRERTLTRLLCARIQAEGPLRSDAFMEVVLYHPQFGYYTHEDAAPVGPEGDFYTVPRLTPVFARTLARRIRRAYDEAGQPPDFRLVEVGAGDGSLGVELVRALAEIDTRSREWTYVIVERGRGQSDLAARRMRSEVPLALSAVHTQGSLAADGPFSGVVLGNELLDALPARRLVRHGDAWFDLVVEWTQEGFHWVRAGTEMTLTDPPLPPADEGAILEWVPLADAFLRELADHLHHGVALFLDYGAEEEELVKARSGGTLQALRGHRSVSETLATPGRADLSTFVNWTRWRAAARRAGLKERSWIRQVNALEEWGVEDTAREWVEEAFTDEERVRRHLAMKNLFFGFENFWVWELVPGTSTGLTANVT